MRTVLEVRNLTGGYSINKPVLHDISFELKEGEMVGFIGLNGAGKSTTIKHILGLMRPHSGSVRILGRTLEEDPQEYRSAFAYVPETPLMYEELTVREHLELTGMVYGLERRVYAERTERLADEFRMKERLNSFSAHLSKGMRQKMMIMNAFLAEPPLYIIDEPFLGLDPLGIRSLLERLGQVKASGSSILVSTHILSTVEKYCDRFLVLHNGRLLAEGTPEQLAQTAGTDEAGLEEVFHRLVTGDL
jgi:ABC-2 type transport system ATP-binding protein